MIRNRSAQLSVRTPASPLCRSMMRAKVFQGTNSITCANSVLPTFMRHSRSLNPESIANEHHAIQIVDTLNQLENLVITGLAGRTPRINRTPVNHPMDTRYLQVVTIAHPVNALLAVDRQLVSNPVLGVRDGWATIQARPQSSTLW